MNLVAFALIIFGYHLFTLLMMLWNFKYLDAQRILGTIQKSTISNALNPKLSICIPARNEEKNIGQLLQSIALQEEAPDLEILVLDDHSEDKTADRVREAAQQYDQLKIQLLKGKSKPEDWLGKPYACNQLAEEAKGDILIFLDADTQISPTFTSFVSKYYATPNAVDLLSFWPKQHLSGFWQPIVLPWMYRALMTHLAVKYQFTEPAWMPSFFYKRLRPLFAAANGQCLIFKRAAYEQIDGHNVVKEAIIEDIALSKAVLSHANLKQRILIGEGYISCRMYEDDHALYQGLRKNFFAGFNYHSFPFIASGLLHLIFFLLPYALILSSNAILVVLGLASIICIFAIDLILRKRYKWDLHTAFLNALGPLWYCRLAIDCMLDHWNKRSVFWKGRKL